MVLTTSPAQIKKRSHIPSGTILVKIDESPFTACEMTRPKGHESFYCFVDRDKDGSFDGVYHLFSNSYFLLSGWTNRTPRPVLPFSYQPEEPSNSSNSIIIIMALESIKKTEYKFKVSISSKERQDYWVYLGDLIITPDNVGKEINIVGSVVSVLSFSDRGPLLRITPPEIGSVVNFTVPKQMPNGLYSGSAVEGRWTEIK